MKGLVAVLAAAAVVGGAVVAAVGAAAVREVVGSNGSPMHERGLFTLGLIVLRKRLVSESDG
jgi:hypothetical protein